MANSNTDRGLHSTTIILQQPGLTYIVIVSSITGCSPRFVHESLRWNHFDALPQKKKHTSYMSMQKSWHRNCMPTFNASARVLIQLGGAVQQSWLGPWKSRKCNVVDIQPTTKLGHDVYGILVASLVLKRVPTPLLLDTSLVNFLQQDWSRFFWVPRMKVSQGDKDSKLLTRVTVYKTMPWVWMSRLAWKVPLFKSKCLLFHLRLAISMDNFAHMASRLWHLDGQNDEGGGGGRGLISYEKWLFVDQRDIQRQTKSAFYIADR